MMAAFDNLRHEPLQVPEERTPEELERGDEVYNKQLKVKTTSVSVGRFFSAMKLMALLCSLSVLALLAFVIYSGVKAFTG